MNKISKNSSAFFAAPREKNGTRGESGGIAHAESRSCGKKWSIVRLGEVGKINYGTRIRSKDSTSNDYPVYGGGGKTFGWSEFNRENQCVVSRFAMSEECVRYVSGRFFLNDSGLTVDVNNERINQCYLNWFLLGHQKQIYSLGRGCAQKNLRVDEFLNLRLPLPSLSEQRRIAGVLDRISEMKRNVEARIKKLDLLVKARFSEMFGDGGGDGRGNGEEGRGKRGSRGDDFNAETQRRRGTKMVRLGDVASLKAGKFISAKNISMCGRYPCYGGNGIRGWVETYNQEGVFPLIGRQGALCGNVQLAKGRFYATEHAVVVKPIVEWHPIYMLYLLRKENLGRYATGAAQPGLSVTKLEGLNLFTAPLSLQQEFAAFVEKVESLKAIAKKELEKVDLLYRAKLQEFFG